MKRNISVTGDVREKLVRIFNVTERTVRNALDLEHKETDMIKRIRIAAKKNGGVVMVTLPEMETIHTADGRMVQRFGNGAVLTFYRADGHGELWHKGNLVSTHKNVGVKDIFALQDMARNLR